MKSIAELVLFLLKQAGLKLTVKAAGRKVAPLAPVEPLPEPPKDSSK